MLPSSTTASSKRSSSAMPSMPPEMSRRSNSSMQPPAARIKPFAQSVGALAYYTIIIQCIVVSDGDIIPPYNITGIIPQLYIWTNNPLQPMHVLLLLVPFNIFFLADNYFLCCKPTPTYRNNHNQRLQPQLNM